MFQLSSTHTKCQDFPLFLADVASEICDLKQKKRQIIWSVFLWLNFYFMKHLIWLFIGCIPEQNEGHRVESNMSFGPLSEGVPFHLVETTLLSHLFLCNSNLQTTLMVYQDISHNVCRVRAFVSPSIHPARNKKKLLLVYFKKGHRPLTPSMSFKIASFIVTINFCDETIHNGFQ